MEVVILAAGLGSRLKELTRNKPKAMVEVNGKCLIDYSLEFLEKKDIKRIYVIGGYQIAVLKKHLEQFYNGKIELIENTEYEAGSTLTLEKSLEKLTESFLLMNADHIYSDAFIDKIIQHQSDDKIIAMTDKDRQLGEDDMKIKLTPNKKIMRISKKLIQYDLGYIGMTYVGKNKLDVYKKAVYSVIASSNGSANVEAVLDYLAEKIEIEVQDLSGLGWYEIDDQEDLKKAEKALK